MTCIDNRMRDITKLNDFYNVEKKIPDLLICNQNNTERINKRNFENSELLKNVKIPYERILQNGNDNLYKRNVPEGNNIPINIDFRPLPSSYCSDPKFDEEQKDLQTYNKYEPEIKCKSDTFIPNKGTVKDFFNNIDLDSELKNINFIDNKCSKRLFKTSPSDSKSKLSCYTDSFVNNYKSVQSNRPNYKQGYTWCNFNKCNKFSEFPVCESKEFKCEMSKEEKQDIKILSKEDVLLLKTSRQKIKEENNYKKRLKEYKKILELLNKRNNLYLKKSENELNYGLENTSSNLKQNDIFQYNNGNNSINNIYSPIIKKREYVDENIENLGYKKGLEKALDQKIMNNLKYYEKLEMEKNKLKNEIEDDQYKLLTAYCPNIESIHINKYFKSSNSNVYDIDCRGQTKKMYSFMSNNLDKKNDCYNCEQLFNNQTKRKSINVNKIPHHIINN